jgi:hypothetical protein
MSSRNPSSILYTPDGVELGVSPGQDADTVGLQGILAVGTDGVALRAIKTTADGTVEVTTGATPIAITSGSPLEVVTGASPLEVVGGTVDTNNSSTTPLAAGATFTGTATDVSNVASVIAACKTDSDATLFMEFSPDGTNFDSSLSFSVSSGINEVHRLAVTRKYFRIRLTNTSGSPQTFLRLQAMMGNQGPLTSPLNGTVQSDADSLVTRSVLMGQTDGGDWEFVPVTPEGHLEVAVHGPLLPFGSVHVENLTPVFQTDAVYGVNPGQVLSVTKLTGSVSAADSAFSVSTGTTSLAYGVLESRKRLRYRPGQGSVARFTALYTAPVANSYQIAGIGHSEDGVYFGYGNTADLSDTRFGILYVNRGVRERKTLTVTTGATSASNVTITLNGTPFTVAVTNSSNIQRTVWEISQGTFTGWDAIPVGATVVFLSKSSGVTAGTQTFSAGSTGAAATIVQTAAGVNSTDLFIPQSTWNGDRLDGTGASGVTIDPTKFNVYQIGMQYLGAGAVTFEIEITTADGNNATWVVVHTMKLPNTRTTTSFGNPSFPFTVATYSAGSTTNLTVKIGSFAGFTEGIKKLQGNRFTYNDTVTANTSAFTPAFTVMNPRVYSNRANQGVINLLSVSFAQQHNNVSTVSIIKNGTLTGNPNFISYSTQSMALWDNASTAVSFTDNSQLIWSGSVGAAGNIDFAFTDEITLQPGEWLSVCARSAAGTPTVTLQLNTREDQ